MTDNIETPYTIQQIGSENHAIIDKDRIEFVERRRLGLSRFVIQIRDISSCEVMHGDEGDEILVQRRIGNPMRIGPVDSAAAEAAATLIEDLRQ